MVAVAVVGAVACSGDGRSQTPAAGPSTTSNTEPPVAGWRRLPDPPLRPRTGAVAAWTGHEVVVAGGWDFLCPPAADCATPEDPPYRDGAAYDPERRAWRAIARAPAGFTNAPTAVVGGDVFVIASGTGLLRYRPEKDRWATLPAPPDPDVRALVAAGGDLVAFAVTDEQGERPDWRLDAHDRTWAALPDDPLPAVYDRQLVPVGDDLVLLAKVAGDDRVQGARLRPGGRWEPLPPLPRIGFQAWPVDEGVVVNPHFGPGGGGVLDPRSATWRPLPPGPPDPGWSGDMAGAVGRRGAAYVYASGWVLDVARGVWVEVPPPSPGPRPSGMAIATAGRDLVVYGGERWTGPADGHLLGDAWWWTPPT